MSVLVDHHKIAKYLNSPVPVMPVSRRQLREGLFNCSRCQGALHTFLEHGHVEANTTEARRASTACDTDRGLVLAYLGFRGTSLYEAVPEAEGKIG